MEYHCFNSQLSQQKSILLFVNNGCIGDELMKVPFLLALRTYFPDHHITWMTNLNKTSFGSTLLGIAPFIFDAIVSHVNFNTSIFQLFRNPFKKKSGLGKKFTIIIDLQTTVLYTVILRKIPHDQFISGSANFIFSNAKPAKGYHRPMHITQRCCDLIRIMTRDLFEPIHTLPSLSIYEDDCIEKALPLGAFYVGFVPGSGNPIRKKKWPLERFIMVAREQVKHGRTPVFFLGKKEEIWYDQIKKMVPQAFFPEQQLVGFKIQQGPLLVMTLGKRIQLAVSNDCGTGHMLAAVDVPLVSLFGPTSPNKFAPCTTHKKILCAQQWGSNEMEAIPVHAVTQAIEELIDCADCG